MPKGRTLRSDSLCFPNSNIFLLVSTYLNCSNDDPCWVYLWLGKHLKVLLFEIETYGIVPKSSLSLRGIT